MALTYTKLFQPALLPAAAVKITTIPASPASNILMNGRVRATNNSGAASALYIYVVPSGGTILNSNILINGRSVGVNDYLDTDLPEMAAGDELWAQSTTAFALTLHYMDGIIRS